MEYFVLTDEIQDLGLSVEQELALAVIDTYLKTVEHDQDLVYDVSIFGVFEPRLNDLDRWFKSLINKGLVEAQAIKRKGHSKGRLTRYKGLSVNISNK